MGKFSKIITALAVTVNFSFHALSLTFENNGQTIVRRGDHIPYLLVDEFEVSVFIDGNLSISKCLISEGDLFEIKKISIEPDNGFKMEKIAGTEEGGREGLCPISAVVFVPFPLFFPKFIRPLKKMIDDSQAI